MTGARKVLQTLVIVLNTSEHTLRKNLIDVQLSGAKNPIQIQVHYVNTGNGMQWKGRKETN
jgi:hypothetical protein